MATNFDSFNRSALGAFIRSPLGVRGGAAAVVAIYTSLSYLATIHPSGSMLYVANYLFFENLQVYAHPTTLIPSPYPYEVPRTTGRIQGAEFDLSEGEEPTVQETDYHADAQHSTWIYAADGFSGSVTFTPHTTQVYYSIAQALPLDTDAAPLYMVVAFNWLPLASRNTGVPSCTLPSCSGTWQPEDPPAATVWGNLGASASRHYHVLKRANASSPWAATAAPWVAPTTFTPNVAQEEGKLYHKASSTTIERWDIETDYNVATVSTITSPGSVFISNWWLWNHWLLIETADSGGHKLHLYYDGAFVQTLGSPFDRTDWSSVDIRFDRLAVTTSTGVLFWTLGAGTVTYEGALSGSFSNVDLVDDGYAWSYSNSHLLKRSGGEWVDAGTVSSVEEIDAISGYAVAGVSKGYVWLRKNGGSPRFYAVPVV